MKLSYSALVLATFTIGQAVAGPVKHAHNHLHKRSVDVLSLHKKSDEGVLEGHAKGKRYWNDVNWATVVYTYSKGQTWGDATSAAASKATSAAPAVAAAAKSTTTPPAAAPVATTPASSSQAAAASPAAAAAASPKTVQNVVLSDADKSRLASMGAQQGHNAVSNNGGSWIGSDGPFTSDFTNNSGEELILVVWGPAGSWINAVTPSITHSLAAGATITLSFASGLSGAFCAVYPDTQLVNGQCSNTWGEFTFGSITVYDVSREPNMSGHSISMVGPDCTSNMSTCVFKCGGGANVCTFGYELDNCTPGSQPGAEYGLDFGAPSGGCRLNTGTHVSTTFS